MSNDAMIEAVARAIYETDDVWHIAFPWPNPAELGKADAIRDIARAAIDAAAPYILDMAAEHCEKVAEAFGPNHDASAAFAANAIRGLKERFGRD